MSDNSGQEEGQAVERGKIEDGIKKSGVEIDLRVLWGALYRSRLTIILITILLGSAAYLYAYLKVNIYEAKATIEVGRGSSGGSSKEDVLSSLSDSMSLDTQFDIITSRLVTNIALKHVDWRYHYFVKTRLKEWELYKSSPIRADITKGIGINFFFYPSSDPESFRLQAKGREKEGQWEIDKTYHFNEEIKTPYFELSIHRVQENPIVDGRYRFYVLSPLRATLAALGGISVDYGEGYSSVLTIKNQDTVPLRAQEFLNAIAQAYMEQNIEKKTHEASKMLDFINEQLIQIQKSLDEAAEKLEDFKRNTNTAEMSTKTKLIIGKMSEYEGRLVDISIEESMLNALQQQIMSGKKLESLSIAGLKVKGSTLSRLIQELQQAILKRNSLSLDITNSNREMTKLDNMINHLKDVIANTINNLKLSVKERRKLIQQSIDEQERRLKDLPTDEKIYSRLERNFQVNQEIYSYLLKKRSETAILKASTVSKNRIVDPALLPASPTKPNRMRITALGTILGLMLGILYAVIRELMDDTIKNEEDIRRVSTLPILGQIPHIDFVEEHKIVVLDKPKSITTEAFRTLRANLRYMAVSKNPRVIAITSTVGTEGKSTISANLGAIISLSGKRTIILNLDLRKPALSTLFNLPNNKGMSSLLSGRATLEEVVQGTEYKNLSFIPSGPIPPNPTELIQEGGIENLLKTLKDHYDIIILDTPPIGLVADALSLMHIADISIYVVRAKHSKQEFLVNAERLKSEKNIHSLGILVNDVGHGLTYGYNYGYRSYEHSYYGEEKA